ncbi:MAG TPA: 2-C-methyl-D-erythritol 2,4-cyclodiphosphate synthase [Spirochaetes bacterium]|nr:2-C-methyl-D-erythritol 2,4-cyclodiphosphate synthase [Spirochaetota bacterium]
MFRIGNGYDVHAFAEGRKLILGGVEIPFEMGLKGHSDADVLCHAIADSLLGALALGDIGHFYPDHDKRYEGMDSLILLKEVYERIKGLDYVLINVDSVIICQKPKLAGYIKDMRTNISRTLGLLMDFISVKATTSEGLGFTGRGEGIAVLAHTLIQKIND